MVSFGQFSSQMHHVSIANRCWHDDTTDRRSRCHSLHKAKGLTEFGGGTKGCMKVLNWWLCMCLLTSEDADLISWFVRASSRLSRIVP